MGLARALAILQLWDGDARMRFGSVPLEDQVAGLKALGRRFPEMDLDRVGVQGRLTSLLLDVLKVLTVPTVLKVLVLRVLKVLTVPGSTHPLELSALLAPSAPAFFAPLAPSAPAPLAPFARLAPLATRMTCAPLSVRRPPEPAPSCAARAHAAHPRF